MGAFIKHPWEYVQKHRLDNRFIQVVFPHRVGAFPGLAGRAAALDSGSSSGANAEWLAVAEAFHSILEHDVIDRNVFASYYEAKEVLKRYFSHYNYYRLHRSIGFITPQQKWEETEVVCATTFSENLSN